MTKVIAVSSGDIIITPGSDGKVLLSGNTVIAGSVESASSTTTDLTVNGPVIQLNSGETGTGISTGIAGVLIDRGSKPAATIYFDESATAFDAATQTAATGAFTLLTDTSPASLQVGTISVNSSTPTNLNFDLQFSNGVLKIVNSLGYENLLLPVNDASKDNVIPNRKFVTDYVSTVIASGAASTNINAGNITSGILAIERGGTGASTVSDARLSLGLGSSAVLDATSTNTANQVVLRDALGNFSANAITASLTGNANTATKLQTARTINGVSFDGTANITVADNTKLPLTGGTMTGTIRVSNIIPAVALVESDTSTAGRIETSDSAFWIQAGAGGAGETTSSGSVKVSGFNGTDIGSFTVRYAGAYQTIWHSGNLPVTDFAKTLLDDANAVAARATLGVPAGVDKQICTAWVNFNGTGTVAIRDSYNVSSITDDGVGLYTINFSKNMNNANYVVNGTTNIQGNIGSTCITGTPSVSSFSVRTVAINTSTVGGASDAAYAMYSIFGGK